MAELNETDMHRKYKGTYSGAFIDFSRHAVLNFLSFYGLWFFKDNIIGCAFFIPIVSLMNIKTFTIFHDCVHNSFTPNRKLNFIISHATGLLVPTSPLWGIDHLTHHLTNGNRENSQHFKFNELVNYTEEEYIKMKKWKRLFFDIFFNHISYFTIFPFLYFFIVQRFIYVVKKIKYNKKIKSSLTYVIVQHAINNLGIIGYLHLLSRYNIMWHAIFAYYLSTIIGFFLFHNQHTFNPPYVVNNDKWNHRDSGLVGSSFMQIPWYLQYFFGGIDYHHIHHMNSKIPGYNLHKYHEDVTAHTKAFDNVVKLSMWECICNMKLRLYSERLNKYITLSEAKNYEKESLSLNKKFE